MISESQNSQILRFGSGDSGPQVFISDSLLEGFKRTTDPLFELRNFDTRKPCSLRELEGVIELLQQAAKVAKNRIP